MPMKTVETTTEEDFQKTFDLNVKGPFFLVQKALPHIPSGGRIIFVSTSVIHASTLSPPYTLYAGTKGAIEHMTHAMSKDLASKGITVNAVAPGPVGTELFFKGKSKELISTIANNSPFRRIGEPDELADVYVFLASDASRWVSGQVICVNGAFSFQ
jgi:3-oxoacyl-[acyl-carrier protein] reductase